LFDVKAERAVLGTYAASYLVPVEVDLFELGLVTEAGIYELLPIDLDGRAIWNEVTDLMVTKKQARQQREILLSFYRTLLETMPDMAPTLENEIYDLSRRGIAHAVFGLLRLAAIDTWRTMRHTAKPLDAREQHRLYGEVARRVASTLRRTTND
jgi:hypothetical protein